MTDAMIDAYEKIPDPPKLTTVVIVRSLCFYLLLSCLVIFASIANVILQLLPQPQRKQWQQQLLLKLAKFTTIHLTRLICGLQHEFVNFDKFLKHQHERLLIACNHQSTYEVGVIKYACQPATEVMKKQLMRIPFFANVVRAYDPIIIDRQRTDAARQKLLTDGIKAINNGYHFISYAEGTRRHGYKLGTYKSGAFKMAIEAKAKVLPIVHNSGHYWAANSFWLFPGKVQFVFGDAIDSAGLSPRQLAEKTKAWARANYPQAHEGSSD